MTVGTIIHQVRWCIDEQTRSEDYIDSYMDDLIKSKIRYALRWACYYGDPSLLMDSDEDGSSSGIVESKTLTASDDSLKEGTITLDDSFLKIVRVRVSSWHRGVARLISEDSEEYVMQSDDTAKADANRPVAAYIADCPPKIELYPAPGASDKVYLTVVNSPDMSDDVSTLTIEEDISVPGKIAAAFIYYLAYLVMCAYNDNRANAMLTIAQQNLGIQPGKEAK